MKRKLGGAAAAACPGAAGAIPERFPVRNRKRWYQVQFRLCWWKP